MPDQAQLNATIEVAGAFKVGPNPQPANRFRLSIRNVGPALERIPGKDANLYLKGVLGSGADALFLDDTDARKCVKACQDPGWRTDWDFSRRDEGRFALRIYTFNARLFASGQTLTIEFSQAISKTAAGNAVLSFETDFAGVKQALEIEKRSGEPGVISFYSVPPEGVRNLPGTDVELRWRTDRLSNLELTQVGVTDPLPCDFGSDEGTKTIANVMTDMTLRLRGYDGTRPVERTLGINVLRSGWHDSKNVLLDGDPGYPRPSTEREAGMLEHNAVSGKRIELEPTLLLNGNDEMLYGLFRHPFPGKPRALLFATRNPFGGWRFMATRVLGEAGFVPAGFSSSPGVHADDRIWLVGGSQIDPDSTSNGVWCLDPKEGEAWKNHGAAPWRARMGHAVVVFENRIWVMGGRDEAGNALNDVWVLDPRNGNNAWQPAHGKRVPPPGPGEADPWAPRCLMSPTVFDGKLWMYGGVKEPFSDTLYDDLYVFADGQWEKRALTGIIAGDNDSRRPIASCLQVFQDSLHLFGTFRTIRRSDRSEIVEQLAFRLSSPTTKTWTAIASDGLQNWGADTSFSYQAVNFRDTMLIARALIYGEPNPVLKVYVP